MGHRMNQDKAHKCISALMSILLLCSMVLLSREAALYVTGKMTEKKNITIVIDSGHGGMDPGKIAADGTLEKDLNLSIALKLQKYLEAADIRVVMTRTNDMGLYDENAPNKKVQDMKNRIALMEDCNAEAFTRTATLTVPSMEHRYFIILPVLTVKPWRKLCRSF